MNVQKNSAGIYCGRSGRSRPALVVFSSILVAGLVLSAHQPIWAASSDAGGSQSAVSAVVASRGVVATAMGAAAKQPARPPLAIRHAPPAASDDAQPSEAKRGESRPGSSGDEFRGDRGCQCNADVDNSGGVDLADVVIVTNCVTTGDCSGCINSCDINCDGSINQPDVDAAVCFFQNPGAPPEQCCLVTTSQACCFDDGSCVDLEPADCRQQDGAPRGIGTDCGDLTICAIDQPCEDCGGGGLAHWVDACPAGTDYMPTGAVVGIDTDLDCVVDVNLVMTGNAQINRDAGIPHQMDTEIVAMTLTGGGAALRAGAGGGAGATLPASPGLIIEQDLLGILADSSFDVLFEIDMGGVYLYNQSPLVLYSKIDCVPPDAIYTHFTGCLPLYDSPSAGGTHIANLVSANHDTYPPELCPLDQGFGDCSQLQARDCEGATEDICLPKRVQVDSNGIAALIECDCYRLGPGCGPVQIGTGGADVSCPGNCPNPTETCQIFADGVATGQQSAQTSQFPTGTVITCDCLRPPPDPHRTALGTSVTFGTLDVPSVPADFFGPGSDPFDGTVALVGGLNDTLGQRSGPIVCPVLGPCDPVSVELIQLDLVSEAPITVQPGGTQWNVRVGLSPTATPPEGTLDATLTHANGGVYDAHIPFVPVFIFTEVGNQTNRRTLDYAALNRLIEINFFGVDWVITVNPDLGILAPNDGDFVSGVREVVQGDPTSQIVVDALGESKGGGVAHPVQPPPPPPPPDPHITVDGTSATFGTLDVPPIPAGFFGPGSDPFEGAVNLEGGANDTLGQRSGPINCPAVGPCDPVAVELVQLDLVSVTPITVSPGGSMWDVAVDLSPLATPPLGTLTATRTHANGGTYDAHIPFSPRFTFTEVGVPGNVRVLDYDVDGIAPIEINLINAAWVISLGADLAGTIDAPNDGNFVPGVLELIQGDPNSQIVVQSDALSKGGGIDHPVSQPPLFCPVDPAFGDCTQLQQRDCQGTTAELCLPRLVQIIPGGAEPFECTCFEPGPGCGPVQIAPAGDIVSCPGDCPNATDVCVLHLSDGTSTGLPSANSSDFADGEVLSCGCETTCTKLAPAGPDCWATACDGSTKYDFGETPIPADFFGPGSDPFTGSVPLGGATGGLDTTIQRLDDMCFDGPLPVAQTVPIEITQLDLVSCDPIIVTEAGGQNPQEWNVYVQLAGTQQQGTLDAVKTHDDGGTYTATVPVNAQFMFERVSDGVMAGPLPAGNIPLSTTVPAPWTQAATCPSSCGGVGFCPGLQTDPGGGGQCCVPTCHQGPTPGHEHCTQPPDCQPCPECTWNNGLPLDDFGGPASQYDDFPAEVFSAEAADDFFFTGKGDNPCDIRGARFWATHFNVPAGITPDPATQWTGVTISIYANADPKGPAGHRNDDGTFTAGLVATSTAPMSAVTVTPVTLGCIGTVFQIDVNLGNAISLEKNVKYWVVFQPHMDRTNDAAGGPGYGQVAVLLSEETHEHPAQQIFNLAGLPTWTVIPGNSGSDGTCNTLPPGSLKDIAFELFAVKPGNLEPPIPAPAPHDILKNRYISIDPRGAGGGNVGQNFDIRVTLTGTLVPGVTQVGSSWFAGPPDADCISTVSNAPGVAPNWDACPTLHLAGCPTMPTSNYDIEVVGGGILAAQTQALPGGSKWFGDVVGNFDPVGDQWTPPDGLVSINDAVAAIKTYQNPSLVGPGCGTPPCNATHVSVTDVHPAGFPQQPWGTPNQVVDINDVFAIILGFQGKTYPGPQIQNCP